MKIDKAVEVLKLMHNTNLNYYSPDRKAALKLGIEALKARKVWQDNEGFDPNEALPGETE